MEAEIKGFPSDNRINELLKAIHFISKAKEIMYKEYSNQEVIRKNKGFSDAMYAVESNCNNIILFFSQAIADLILHDLTEK